MHEKVPFLHKKHIFNITFSFFIVVGLILLKLYSSIHTNFLIYFYLISSFYLVIRKRISNSIQLILFLISIATGFIFYYDYTNPQMSFSQSLYSTIRLFSFNVEENIKVQSGGQPLLEISRWSAGLFVIFAILTHLYRLTYERVMLIYYKIVGGHFVIMGSSDAAVILAKDLKNKGKKVVLIGFEKNDALIKLLNKSGVIFIHGSSKDLTCLHKAGVKSASHFISMTKKDKLNIDSMMNLKTLVETESLVHRFRNKLICSVHLENIKFDSIIGEMQASILKSDHLRSRIEIRIFNNYQNTAKLLFHRVPLYKGKENQILIQNSAPVHLLIIGFGKTGQEILLQAAKIGHFPNQTKFEVTIIDKNADEQLEKFKRRYKAIDDICNFNKVYNMDIESNDTITQFLEQNKVNPFTYITICLADDHRDFINGLLLFEEFQGLNLKQIPIMIKVREDIKLASWLQSNTMKFLNINCFGGLHEVASADVIVDEKLDSLAKAVNESYAKMHGLEQKWEELGLFLKSSNRAQTDHIDTKLISFGLVKKEQEKVNFNDIVLSKKEFQKRIMESDFFEQVAIAEHKRWMAFHLLHGWKKKESCDCSESHQNPEKKLHVCLVPWEELDTLGEKYNRNFKENDKNTIFQLYDLLISHGYVICENIKNYN